MSGWARDPISHRLVKGNFETFFDNLFDSLSSSHSSPNTSHTMVDNETIHEEHVNVNVPMRTMREYLQLP